MKQEFSSSMLTAMHYIKDNYSSTSTDRVDIPLVDSDGKPINDTKALAVAMGIDEETAVIYALQAKNTPDELLQKASDFFFKYIDTDPDPSPKPGAVRLRHYWTRGKGAAKIRWGTPGDWKRCVRQLTKYVGPSGARGLCQVWHKEVNGYYTGDRRNKDYEPELEYKRYYSNEDRQTLGERGHAFRNHNGEWSYPIDDVEDLKNAIQAFGRSSSSDREKLKSYIERRAKALGREDLIPENWSEKALASEVEMSEVLLYAQTLIKLDVSDIIGIFYTNKEENGDG